MAIIGKIRERSGLLIVLVGGAMVAFILSDLFTNRGPSAEDQVIGEVGGDPILLQKFERRVNDEVESYRNDFGQQVDGAMQEQIRQRVWNEMVRDRVYGPHVREAGLAVVKDEYDDIRFGDNILPEFRNQPNFQDPQTGEPDRQALRQYFEAVQLNAPVYHAIQRDRLVDQRLYNKYETLVQRSIFANSAQAREEFASRNAKVTFDFVAKRYDSEPDSLYPVSENDLEKYYNAHKNDPRHQQKASRGFSYVTFPVTPTLADREALRDELAGLKADFEAAENDSLFVVGNSDTRVYSVMPYVAGTADAATDTLLLNAAVGTVVGPYQQGETWKLSKVVELAKVEEARVRHILLSTQGKDQLAIDGISARADSLLRVVKRDRSKFEELVTEFSEDPGSVQNGGVYEWFDRGRMVPEFTAASFDEPVGAITIARTSYGFHIVEVLGQRERDERRIASIDRQMRPSPGTFNTMYKEANDFSLRFTSPEAFKSGAEEAGRELREVEALQSGQRTVAGLTDAAALVSWANRAELGEISEPLLCGDDYVVARLTAVREEGAPALEDVREEFTREVVKEKKAEAFKAQMSGRTDLNALAAELGSTVRSASDVTFSSFNIPGGFSEYEVIGKIFTLDPGQTSVPLKGDVAVYVVNLKDKVPAPELEDASSERTTLEQRASGRVSSGLFNALRDAAGVKDQRSKYY